MPAAQGDVGALVLTQQLLFSVAFDDGCSSHHEGAMISTQSERDLGSAPEQIRHAEPSVGISMLASLEKQILLNHDRLVSSHDSPRRPAPMQTLGNGQWQLQHRHLRQITGVEDHKIGCSPGPVPHQIKHPAVVLCLSTCLLYTSPSPRDGLLSRMPSSA